MKFEADLTRYINESSAELKKDGLLRLKMVKDYMT